MQTKFADNDIVYYGVITSLQDINEAKGASMLMLIVKSGKANVSINRRLYTIEADDVLICAPHEHISPVSYEDDFSCSALTFSQQFMMSLPMGNTAIWNNILYCEKIRQLKVEDRDLNVFNNYVAIMHQKLDHLHETADISIYKLMTSMILIEIGKEFKIKSGKSMKTITLGQKLLRRFLNLIAETEVKRQPVSYYARILGVTPKYLTTACTRFSDKNASQWIQSAVMLDIQDMMLNPELSFKTIAEKLGFPNLSSFSIFVKRNLNESPTSLRKKLMAKT